MSVLAILLAAGKGERFGRDKLWLPLGEQPVWHHSFRVLRDHPAVDEVGIVCSGEQVDRFRKMAPEATFVVSGGSSRQESALRGLLSASTRTEFVIFHDAARPFVSVDLVQRVVDCVRSHGAAAPGVPVTDTIKQACGEEWTTLDRSGLIAVQTPQGGRLQDFLRAHRESETEATDDAALLERIGIHSKIVEGDKRNMKLTTPEDLAQAAYLIGVPEVRTGHGYDVHRFSDDPDRAMWLGGIEFDDRPGLEGHSDADALIHAVCDSLLGAANLGDIGQLFPNTDPAWKDVRSSRFLTECAARVRKQGWDILFVDCSVIAERPKITPRKQQICATLADALGISEDRVSVKATTNEKLGAIGRGEGIAAFAVSTLRRSS